jgi:hypothetical protein
MSYYQAKLNCQMEGEFKKSHNLIRITKGNRELLRQDPLSSPENVYSNMKKLIEEVNKSDENVIREMGIECSYELIPNHCVNY